MDCGLLYGIEFLFNQKLKILVFIPLNINADLADPRSPETYISSFGLAPFLYSILCLLIPITCMDILSGPLFVSIPHQANSRIINAIAKKISIRI